MKNNSLTSSNIGSISSTTTYNNNLSPSQQQIPSPIIPNLINTHHLPLTSKMVSKVKARLIVKGVKSALKEVEAFEKGTKKPKTLDQLLNEL